MRRRAARSLPAARGGGVERLVPGRPPERPPLRACAHERMQQPLLRVHALEVVRHLAAQEAGRDRVVGVALDARRAASGIDLDEQRAGVGTIVRACPADDSGGGVTAFSTLHARPEDPPEPPSFRPNPIALGATVGSEGPLTDSLTAHRRRVPGVRVFIAAALAAGFGGRDSRAASRPRTRRHCLLYARFDLAGNQRLVRPAGRGARQPAPRVARPRSAGS